MLATTEIMQAIGSNPDLFKRYANDSEFQELCSKANGLTDGAECLRFVVSGLLNRIDAAELPAMVSE